MIDEKLKNEITETLKQSPISCEVLHGEAALKWLLLMKPDADLSLQISALGHDIQRGADKAEIDWRDEKISPEEYLEQHQKGSAEALKKILTKFNYEDGLIEKVICLVEKHEVGGDDEQNLLKDADSISYFECNVPMFLNRFGEEKTREKIRSMFDRSSKRAKEIILEMQIPVPEAQRLIDEELK